MHPISSAPRRPPHFLSCAFRPFFLLGALAMAASVLVWLPMLMGEITLPTTFAPRDWHIHTMLFGAVPAIIAGFALTAVANWTGRKPVAGGELVALVALWLFGQAAVTTSTWIGAPAAAAIDVAFPLALVTLFGREVVAGGNLRNLRIVALVLLLGVANAAFHAEAAMTGLSDYSARAGIAIVLVLVMLVGGRIIPAFTRNWLAARDSQALPAPFSRLDAAALAGSACALVGWTAAPTAPATGLALVAAGALNAVRLARWCGWRTRPEPLLAILHVAFATVPLGFAIVGASILFPDEIDPVSAVHVWTVGTFGTLTLAVMMRASRGHSGRPLRAGRLEILVFVLVLTGAGARVAAPYTDGAMLAVLDAGALAWVAAYLGFALGYARMLVMRPGPPA